jgi:hypothetical protein
MCQETTVSCVRKHLEYRVCLPGISLPLPCITRHVSGNDIGFINVFTNSVPVSITGSVHATFVKRCLERRNYCTDNVNRDG